MSEKLHQHDATSTYETEKRDNLITVCLYFSNQVNNF